MPVVGPQAAPLRSAWQIASIMASMTLAVAAMATGICVPVKNQSNGELCPIMHLVVHVLIDVYCVYWNHADSLYSISCWGLWTTKWNMVKSIRTSQEMKMKSWMFKPRYLLRHSCSGLLKCFMINLKTNNFDIYPAKALYLRTEAWTS